MILDALGWWNPAQSLDENLNAWLGWHNLEERSTGMETIDPVVLAELRRARL